MSEQTKTVKSVFKAVLPVALALVLIVLIAVVATTAKNCNSKAPTLSNADEVYVSVGNLEVTNERLYVYLKQSYGLSELLRLVDNILYADEVEEAQKAENAEKLQAFINESLYGVEDLDDYEGTAEDLEKAKKDVVESLLLTGLLTEEESKDEAKVNAVIKSYYALQYARKEWAKEEYLNRYFKDRQDNGYDTFFDKDEIEKYYEKNYLGQTTGFYIPFTSKEAALKMMARYGINTQTEVLKKNGWVTDAYDYNKDTTINDSQYLTNLQVIEKFIGMYNEVYSELNSGNDILSMSDLTKSVNSLKTAHAVKNSLSTAMTAISSSVTKSATLPTTATVDNAETPEKNTATIKWSIEDNEYLELSENTLILKQNVTSSKTVKLTATVTYDEKVSETTFSLKVTTPTTTTIKAEKIEAEGVDAALTAAEENIKNAIKAVTVKGTLSLPTSVSNGVENTDVTVSWTAENNDNAKLNNNKLTVLIPAETDAAITLHAKLECNGTTKEFDYEVVIPASKTKISVADTDAYEEYHFTDDFLANHKEGDFKFVWTTEELTELNSTLATQLKPTDGKLTVSDEPELFYKSYTVTPVAVGDYYMLMIKLNVEEALPLESVEAEIVEKMKEELLTDNNITNMIYTRRNDVKLQIFDRYLEALYDYEYTKFFETTLSLKEGDYEAFKASKKRTTTDVATFEFNGTKHTITADQLFSELEVKYGPNTALSLVKLYQVVNSEFNTIYNPYTEEVFNKDYFKDILETEVYALRKNFELEYFTYPYLEYYGFIPNFPSKYGWNNFIKDYFGSFSEEELSASSSFGGTIYGETYQALIESLYTDATIDAEMAELLEKWYSVSAHNIIIGVDRNFDGSPDTDFDWAGTTTPEGKTYEELAKGLAQELLAHVSETCENSYKAGLSSLINIYKKADIVAPTAAPTASDNVYNYNFWAEYKQAGLIVKLESDQSYSWNNNIDNTFDTETSKLVEEFTEEVAKLYKKIAENDLLDSNLDVVLSSEEAFATTYGYHMVVVTKGNGAEDMPTAEEIRLHKAFTKVADYKEATTQYGKDKLAEAEKELKDLLAELGYEEDYTLDTETTKKLTTWFDQAIHFIEEGDLFNDTINAQVQKLIDENQINFKDSAKLARFQYAVNLAAEDEE